MSEIICPGCGRTSEHASIHYAAEEFCTHCDFPLFWAPSNIPAPKAGVSSDTASRRLPGAGGRSRVGSKTCPTCGELNPLDETLCLRCRNELDPKPVEPEPPKPPKPPPVLVAPPQPLPEPVNSPWWIWLAAGGTAVALIIVLILLT